jgi:regulator of sirC expression with transglutaminase-like and TPR domain
LLRRFENEMSPRIFFYQIPLCRCSDESKSWLVPLTHELWLRREKVKKKIDTAMEAYEAAEKAYETAHAALEQLPEAPTIEDLGPFKRILREFTTACETLSRVISVFPDESRCV